jgi:hypothetical protein
MSSGSYMVRLDLNRLRANLTNQTGHEYNADEVHRPLLGLGIMPTRARLPRNRIAKADGPGECSARP